MKKKYLIVVADYYKDISDGLIKSALKIISKKLEDLSKKKVLVISSSLKKGLSSLLSEVWKRI